MRSELRIGLVVSLLVAACTEVAPPVETSVPPMTVRDSAGVRIVSAGFSFDSLATSEMLVVADTLLNGARPSEEALVGLGAVQPLADSSLVVFSASGPSLVRFALGANTAPDTLGHMGLEPGAYSSSSSLLPYTMDTLLLWDRDAGRLSRVTRDGVSAPVLLDYPLSRLVAVSGALRDGSPIAITVPPLTPADAGVSRAEIFVLRFAPDGRSVDTMLSMRGTERTVQIGPPGTVGDRTPVRAGSVPFGRTTLWTVGLDGVVLLDTEACHIRRYSAQGTLTLQLDFHCAIEAVTDEDRAQFLSEVLKSARSRADSGNRERFMREASFPPAKSTASALLVDLWGRIWLRLPERGPTNDWIWWVFAEDGTPLARFGLAREWRVAAVREHDLIAVQADRDDAPPVVVRMALPRSLHLP